MKLRYKVGLVAAFLLVFVLILMVVTHGANFALFNPAGQIAVKERNLMYFTLALSVVVVIPVFIMTFGIAWKYRAQNTVAEYKPDWDNNVTLETLWWGVPFLIILILSVAAWKSSHDLDPNQAIVSSKPALTVQVVALDWKWLFIYPTQHIATINELEIPQGTPVNFQITSDSPMNSFWIPQLGGQIYAMPGMSTQLHLIADSQGTYRGVSANISGFGFAGMQFLTHSVSMTAFNQWVAKVQSSKQTLDQATYAQISQPSVNPPVSYYTAPDSHLYDDMVMKFMTSTQPSIPSPQPSASQNPVTSPSPTAMSSYMPGMDMSNMNM